MKRIFVSTIIGCAVCFAAISAEAVKTVQRTLDSSFEKYSQYVKTVQGQTFIDGYLKLAEDRVAPVVSIEECLESAYLGQPSEDLCLKSVQGLAAFPLNLESKEILLALLQKIDHFPKMKLFKSIKEGLLRTHSDLFKGKAFSGPPSQAQNSFSKLELKAFVRLLSQKINGSDYVLLINGKNVGSLSQWRPMDGIFQWSLISNTHRPVILISTFSQFASTVAKELTSFADSCETLQNYEIQSHGLLRVEVFSNSQCVAKERILEKSEHLTTLPSMKPSSGPAKNAWIWTAVALIGAGAAASLKGKTVKVSWPSSF